MFRQSILSMLALLSLIGCAHHTAQAPQSGEQIRPVASFSSIKALGAINVNLRTGCSRPGLIIHADQREFSYIKTSVVNGLLTVSLTSGHPKIGSVSIDVCSRFLNSFRYKGNGIINGSHLRSSVLDLSIDNKGQTNLSGELALRNLDIAGGGSAQIQGIHGENLRVKIGGKSHVQLSGEVNLTYLDMKNDAWISLYWIKTKNLVIKAKGHAFIQFAGVAERMDVELCDAARFNGRYLRATRAFVKTHNQAVAEISSVDRQHTLATDASNIYFYNIPEMRADFMANAGSVLDLRDWSMPFTQEYDRYNK